MTQRSKVRAAAFAAALLLLVAVGSASASHLSVNEQRYRIAWTSLEYVEPVFNTATLCPITLEGSFHSATFTKTAGALIGYINSASVQNPCRNGEATLLTATLPWTVQYAGFRGTLPNITGIVERLVGFALQFHSTVTGTTCLMRSEAAHPLQWIAEVEGGVATRVTVEPTQSIPCGSFFEGHFRGSGILTRPGATRPEIRITLI